MKRTILTAAVVLAAGCVPSGKTPNGPKNEGQAAAGNVPAVVQEDVPEKTPATLLSTAPVLSKDRHTNQVRFEQTYTGKRIRVLGLVKQVKQVGSQVHVHLNGEFDAGHPVDVVMKFAKGHADGLADLNKDQVVLIDGTGESSVLGDPVFGHCRLVGVYKTVDEANAAAKQLP